MGSQLRWARKYFKQIQAALKFSGSSLPTGKLTTVRAKMWVRGVGPWDSFALIDRFMHVVNYTTAFGYLKKVRVTSAIG